MRRVCLVGVMACAALALTAAAAGAGDRGRSITARFVKLTERRIGEREYVGLVIREREGDEQATVYVSRKQKDILELARRLRKNQLITVRYIVEDRLRWVTRLKAHDAEGEGEKRREGDKDREHKEREGDKGRQHKEREGDRDREHKERDRDRAHKEREGDKDRDRERDRDREGAEGARDKQMQRLLQRLERLEVELRELRREVARLRRDREGDEGRERQKDARRERERDERREGQRDKDERREGREREGEKDEARGGIPAALRGFRGMLVGTVTAKGDGRFAMKVRQIARVWDGNRADNPKAAVGSVVWLALNPKSRMADRQRAVLRTLKVGDRVSVEPFDLGGDCLTVVEELKKIE